MIVAVQKELSSLRTELNDMGFDTVIFGEYPYPIDAVVYKGITKKLINSVKPTPYANVLLIDSTNKTAAEIGAVLKSGLYSPLFFDNEYL